MDKSNLRSVCTGGLLAALYIATTAINPVGYGIIQLRVSAIISIIPFFKREYRFACIAAVAIANLFSPLGLFDVAAGVLLWSLAYFVLDSLLRNIWFKCVDTALLSGLIIGGELAYILGVPFWFNLLSIALSQMLVFSVGVYICKRLFRVRRGVL